MKADLDRPSLPLPREADVLAPSGTLDRPAGRLAALDGLRGVAVLAVMAFHAGLNFVHGGLLGVDVFFVLSGFLITALLVSEHARTGRISLSAFWRRRLRRLLPAMLLMLVVTVLVWRFTAEVDEIPGLRRDAIATLTYVANWHFAVDGQSYFEHFRAPSPLLHMWSLAVEEQFYVLWPVVAILVLRRGTAMLRRVALGGALLSTGLLALLSLLGSSNERLYYGTDTRMTALLVGAAFATLITPFGAGSSREAGPERTQRVASVLGSIAAVLLLVALLFVNGQSTVLYRGGFLLVALLVAVLLASALLAPQGPMSRAMSFRPLVAVGRISYGLYLWHWPVYLFLSAERTGLAGVRLMAVRFAATFAVAGASWFALERRVLRRDFGGRRVLVLPATAVVAALALLIAPLPAARPGSNTVDLDALERQSMSAPAPPPDLADTTVLSRPVRVLVSGDSVSLTLGVAFEEAAARNDTQAYARGRLGCGISTYSPIRTGGNTGAVLDECRSWPEHWAEDVATYKPDVAAVLLGRWESMDRMYKGHWVSLGDPEFDAYLGERLDYAIDILSKHGAKVALLTAPTYDSLNLPDGSDPPEDDPARVARWNQLLHDAAARHPDKVRVFELAPLIEPHGTYQRYSDDDQVELRTADGIHIGYTGGVLAGDALLPQLRDWARGLTP